jgi:hypothetical protein
LLPSLVLNPSGELEIADAIAGGRFLWRHPNLLPGFIKYIFDPIYQDENVLVNVGFIRMKGQIELLALLQSFYEYCDFRLLLLQIFGGLDRWIYPRFFSSFIVLPSELINYEYNNPVTGLHYKLNWQENGAYRYLVKSTNRNELVLPCEIKPIYKMVSMSDNSERYGGTEKLAEWRLTSSFEYEVEIPAYMILETNYLAKQIDLNLTYGSVYTANPIIGEDAERPPVNRQIYQSNAEYGLDETSASYFQYDPQPDGSTFDSTCSTIFVGDYLFNTRYYHVVTAAEAQQPDYFDIGIPETITDRNSLIVWGPYGELEYGDHYQLRDGGDTLRIFTETVPVKQGWILELFVYKKID